MSKKIVPIILVLGILLINIVSIFYFDSITIWSIITSIIGVISVVLSTEGHIDSYYLGIISTITYIVVAFSSKFYGTVMLQGLFFLPMNFIGIFNWKKNLNEKSSIVKIRRTTFKKAILIFVGGVSFALLYGMILKLINGNSPLLDALITGFSLISMYLSVKRYKENWIFWMMISIINIVMWTISAIEGSSDSLLMAITWFMYLLIDIYGFVNWNKMAKEA